MRTLALISFLLFAQAPFVMSADSNVRHPHSRSDRFTGFQEHYKLAYFHYNAAIDMLLRRDNVFTASSRAQDIIMRAEKELGLALRHAKACHRIKPENQKISILISDLETFLGA